MKSFDRNIVQSLQQWKSKKKKKPLLLLGARQVGKTTVLKKFGAENFTTFVYLNFERQQEIHTFFENSKNPKKIIENISLFSGKKIKPQNSLIVFDEIQECNKALNSLKYFNEELPEYNIIAAGSLLGISLGADKSFPVGKVSFLNMFPLTFSEYLKTADEHAFSIYNKLLERETISPIEIPFYNLLLNHFKQFMICGGMPEAAVTFLENKNFEELKIVQSEILKAYTFDFSKHSSNSTSTKINYVFRSLPSQLAKENKKFLYKTIKSGARAREYEEAINWLEAAGLVIKVQNITKPNIPLQAYNDLNAFKMYLFDTGLLFNLAELNPSSFLTSNKLLIEFKGALAENYVAQALQSAGITNLYYWTSAGHAELDFVINLNHKPVAIEVKSGKNTKAKSLKVYRDKYKPELSIILSEKNLAYQNNVLNIPIFYADKLDVFSKKVLIK